MTWKKAAELDLAPSRVKQYYETYKNCAQVNQSE